MRIDFGEGIVNVGDQSYKIKPYPAFLQHIIDIGGIVNYVQQRLGS